MPSSTLASGIVALSFAASALAQTCNTCNSYGVDFQSGGSYFQDITSTADFTAVEEFQGCTNDTAYNVLVDPSGNQYQCNNVYMQPDLTPEFLTCPITKSEMTTGDWSLIVLSNNGDCAPIDYQRDFYISVGTVSTETVAPSIVISTVVTPVESDTSTITSQITSTAAPSTTTVASYTLHPTVTIHPKPTVTTVTKTKATLTKTYTVVDIVKTTIKTVTAQCTIPAPQSTPDPTCSISVTIAALNTIAARDAAPEPQVTARSGSTEFRRALLEGRAAHPDETARFLAERSEFLRLEKRAPDNATVIFTDTNLAVATVTSTSYAATTTVTATTTVLATTTTTPVITVSKGVSVTVATVTATTKTYTITTVSALATTTKTTTKSATLTLTSTTTPASVASACATSGGSLARHRLI